MPSTLAPGFTAAHYIANLSLFLIWITGGTFLVVGGLLTFEPFGFRARKSDPLSAPAQVHRSMEINLAWTVIPVLVLVLLIA
jgi:cytochrome c oxidase subunit 2